MTSETIVSKRDNIVETPKNSDSRKHHPVEHREEPQKNSPKEEPQEKPVGLAGLADTYRAKS